jgi:hypothetical protein
VFEAPRVESVTAQLEQWETTNQDSLRKLVVLLKKVVMHVQDYGKAVIRYSEQTGNLSITQTNHAANLIPDDLIAAWGTSAAATDTSEAEDDDDNGDDDNDNDNDDTVSITFARRLPGPCADHLQTPSATDSPPAAARADSPVPVPAKSSESLPKSSTKA